MHSALPCPPHPHTPTSPLLQIAAIMVKLLLDIGITSLICNSTVVAKAVDAELELVTKRKVVMQVGTAGAYSWGSSLCHAGCGRQQAPTVHCSAPPPQYPPCPRFT